MTLSLRGRISGGGIRGFVEYRGLHPDIAVSELRKAIKQANLQTVKFWHRKFLPRHFETGASQRYQYDARTPKYRRQKRRLIARGKSVKRGPVQGPARALVLTGTLQRNAVRRIKVSGSSNRARGTMTGTQIANFNTGQRGRPDVPKEMLTLTREEQRKMRRFHQQEVEQFLNRVDATKTKRT